MDGAPSSGGHDVREQKPEGCPPAFLLSYRQEDTLHRDIRAVRAAPDGAAATVAHCMV